MDLQEYVRIVRQRWLLIVLTTLATVGVGLGLTLQATPTYESTSRLFVSTPASDTGDAYQGGQFSGQRVQSYAELLTGQEISRRVIEKLNLNETPRVLAARITAAAKPGSVVLSITVTDVSASRAQKLAQTTAEVFVGYVAEVETPVGKSTAPVKASIVDPATKPTVPVSPRPLRNVILALLLGLMGGTALAIGRDVLDTRIRSVEGLRRAVGEVPLLGTIHFDKGAAKHPLITGLSGHSPRVEAFRVLRTNMRFLKAGATSKVFVFTSPLPGDGKSSTICNVALSFAETGERVLLIEGDLRRPRATEYLGLANSVGVTSVLVGAVSVNEAIQPINENADLLARGTTPPNPAELLQSERMAQMLIELRTQYDLILIDAPPLLPVTDAAVLASQSDGAIVVLRHGRTTRDQLDTSFDRLASAQSRPIGVIVNMAPAPRRSRSGYGYGYGYGYAPITTESKKSKQESKSTSKKDGLESKRESKKAKQEAKRESKRAKKESKREFSRRKKENRSSHVSDEPSFSDHGRRRAPAGEKAKTED